jgi:hypothetical protein
MPDERLIPNLHPAVVQLASEFLSPTGSVMGIGIRAQPQTDPPQPQLAILLNPSASDDDEQAIMRRAEPMTAPATPAIVRCGRFGGLGLGAAMAPLDVKRYNIPPVSSGTFGATMKDAGGNLYVLGANHVLAHNGRTLPHTGVFSRGPEDDLNGGTRIAAYSGYVRLKAAPSFNNVADCAWAELPSGTAPPAAPPVNIVDASLSMQVVKIGRTSGKTQGTIHFTDLIVSLDYSFGAFYLSSQAATFDPAGADPPFAEPGDSGALVLSVADPSQAIGLVCARAYTYTGNRFDGYLVIICPLDQVITGIHAHGLTPTLYAV